MKRHDPAAPSKDEKEEHDKTQIPFRRWCRHCVRDRGKEDACKDKKKDLKQYDVHMNFLFMGDVGSERTLAMLVVKE